MQWESGGRVMMLESVLRMAGRWISAFLGEIDKLRDFLEIPVN